MGTNESLCIKVGFSKFADFVQNTVLVGASGTHSVCVCTFHQNVNLMMLGIQHSDIPTYHHCLAKIICNPAQPNCYLGECVACPDIMKLKKELIDLVDDNTDQIVYKHWISTNRSTLETFCVAGEQFVDIFCEKVRYPASAFFHS